MSRLSFIHQRRSTPLSFAFIVGMLVLSFSSVALANPFRGVAYSDAAGLIHMDYTTAARPSSDPQYDDPQYYVGPTQQFYIPIDDPGFTGPGNLTEVAQFGTAPGDCTAQGCLLRGYMWSDKIGWILIDGELINQEISNLISLLPSQEDTPADPYPSSLYPRVLTNGAMVGYAWNEATGWFSFSSDEVNGVTLPAVSQDSTNWGVWIDITGTADPVYGDYEINGYAWSEKIGWVKFNIEPQDSVSFNFGAFSDWLSDTSPPVVPPTNPAGNPPTNAVWLSVGVNSGPSANPRTLVWEDFVGDPQSGIDVAQSSLTVSLTARSSNFCDIPASPVLQCGPGCTTANLVMDNIGYMQLVSEGFCEYHITGNIYNNAGLATVVSQPNPMHLFVRAGVPDLSQSQVRAVNTTAIADGVDPIQYNVELRDIAGNPIVPIDCSTPNTPPGTNPTYLYDGCPGRQVSVEVTLDNPTVFDLTTLSPPTSPYLTPITYGDNPLTVASTGVPLLDTTTVMGTLPSTLGDYSFGITSYAPTETMDPQNPTAAPTRFDFSVDQAEFRVEDEELPPTVFDMTTGAPDITTITPATVTNNFITSGVNPSTQVTFIPAVYTSNPVVTTSGVSDTLTIGVPTDLSFDINNRGASPVNQSGFAGGVSVDSVFQYTAANPIVILMETHRLFDITDPDGDSRVGWSDPNELFGVNTMYELYDGDYFNGAALDSDVSPFFTYYHRFHAGNDFRYDAPAYGNYSSIGAGGHYLISGIYDIPQDYSPIQLPPTGSLSDPANYPAGEIDRSDHASIQLDPATNSTHTLRFTPEKLFAASLNDVQLRVMQGMAYRFEDQPQYAYFYQQPLVSGLPVVEAGFDTTGVVATPERVAGRNFQTLGSANTQPLQESIRRQVATLTSSLVPGNCSVPATPVTSIPTSGACVIKNGATDIIAYYYGDSTETLVLDNSGSGIQIPNNPHTIIVEGGANILIADNIYYDVADTNASLGLIVVADQIGMGANVYVQPNVTNVAAVLYAEGSVMSYSNTGQLYYGAAGGNIQDLSNQLFWQGAIASRNTIGGAYTEQVPGGVSCLPAETPVECSQRYDFDFLRRFTVQINPGPPNPPTTFIAGNGQFSGGGSCPAGTCSCATCEPVGSLPTLITLSGGQINASQSNLAPFFIEPVPQFTENPPPGFERSLLFESSQTIR